MADTQLTTGGVIQVPDSGNESVSYALPNKGEVVFGFDIGEAVFSSSNENLVISMEGQGDIIIENYENVARSGNAPTFTLLNGEQVPGDVYLFVFNQPGQDAETLETAADGGASGSGIGAYTDDSGTLFRSFDRLQGIGSDGNARLLGEQQDSELDASTFSASTATNLNAPSVSGALNLTMEEDGTIIIRDTDILSLVSDPDPGSFLGVTGLTINGGTLTEVRDGSGNLLYWTFEPDADFNGELNISYTVSDTIFTTTGGGTLTVTPVNDAAIFTGDDDAAVVEDVQIATSGDLDVSDIDDPSEEYIDTTRAPEGANYGVLSIDGNGQWTYTLTNGSAVIQQLPAGETLTETITVYSIDGTSHDITVTITGTNDVPTISGDTTGGVTEEAAATLTATGSLLSEDVDLDEDGFSTTVDNTGKVGQLTITENGAWEYTVDNNTAAIQQLGEGDTLTETFTVTSKDGSTTETITITINGTNDLPTISGDDSSSVKELEADVAQDVSLTTSGTLTIDDDDAGESLFDTNVDQGDNIGELTISETGEWTYSIDNNIPEVQELSTGDSFTETFTVTSKDGTTTETITVVVNGTNDAPVITGVGMHASNFEQGATGWTDNTTTETNTDFGSFLGRFGMGDSTAKTFDVVEGTETVSIDFDVYEIDSWTQTEAWGFDDLVITVDGNDIVLPLERSRRNDSDEDTDFRSGTITTEDGSVITWEFTAQDNGRSDIGFGSYEDQIHHMSITITNPGDSVTLELGSTLNEALNNESFGIDNVLVNAVDESGNPVFAILENTATDTAIAQVSAEDIEGDDIFFDLVATAADGTDASHMFTINANGVVTAIGGAGFDFETNASYEITVTPKNVDSEGELHGDPYSFTVHVGDVNEAPVVSGETAAVYEESTVSGSVADPDQVFDIDTDIEDLEFSLVDPDNAPEGLTFNPDGTYTFDASSYELAEGEPLSFDVEYNVKDGDNTSTATLTINVTGVNDAPELSFLTNSSNLLINGSFEDVVIEQGGWAQGHTPEGWQIEGGDRWEVMRGDRFGIDGATDGDNVIDFGVGHGEALIISQTIDSLPQGEYTLTLDAFDRGENLGEASSGVLNVYWNNELIGTIDPNSDNWTSSSFTVNVDTEGDSGTLKLESFNNDGYGIVVDNVRLSTSVEPENNTVSIQENVALGTYIATAVGEDVDTTNLTFSIDTDGPFTIDPNTGVITVNGEVDFEAIESAGGQYAIEVSVSDGIADPVTDTLYVNVGDVNEGFTAPNVTFDSIDEETFITFSKEDLLESASDLDGDDLDVTSVTLENGDGTLVDNGDGTWTFTPTRDWSGDVEFGFTVTDGALTSDRTASVKVENVNDPTLLTFAAAVNDNNFILNGSFESVDIDSGDWAQGHIPEPWELVEGDRWEVMSGNRDGIIGASDQDNVIDTGVGSGEALVISQTINGLSQGQYVIELDLFDRGANLNQPDSGNIDVYWNGQLVGSFNPENIDWETGTIVVDVPEGATSGELVLASHNNDAFGNVIDNITMRSVDTLTENPELNVDAANGTYVATAVASDIDSTDLTFSIEGDSPFSIDPDTGVITLTDSAAIDWDNAGNLSVTVTVTDGQNNTVEETLDIGVNERPTGTDFTVEEINMNQPVEINFVEDTNVFDADGDVTGITITSEPSGGTLLYNGEQVVVGETYDIGSGSFTFEADPSQSSTFVLGSIDGQNLSWDNWGTLVQGGHKITQTWGDNTVTITSGKLKLSGNAEDGYTFHANGTGGKFQQYDNEDDHIGQGIGVGKGDGIENTKNHTESITVDFGTTIDSATVGFDGLGGHFDPGASQDANAVWIAMLDGEIVGSGAVKNLGNGELLNEYTITSEMTGGNGFDEIVFTTDSDVGSNWELRYVGVESGLETSFNYIPVDNDGLPAAEESTVTIDINPQTLSNEAPTLDLAQGTEVTVDSEHASYTNMLGIYFVSDGDPIPESPEVILTNSNNASMLRNVLETFEGDQDVHFFLISDAGSKGINHGTIQSSDLQFVMHDGHWALSLDRGGKSQIVDVQFDIAAFNPDGEEATFQFVNEADGSLTVLVDDQLRTNDDDDFDDLVISVDSAQDNTADYAATYVDSDGKVAVAGNVSINDVDSTEMSGATIVLTNAKDGDILNTGDLPDGMVAEITEANGEITVSLSGDFSMDVYEDVIGGITFENSRSTPDETDRVIEITVMDTAGEESNTATSTIAVVDVAATGQIVLNSGFESTATMTDNPFATTEVDNWSNNGNDMAVLDYAGERTRDNGQFMELDSTHGNDVLSQTIATKAGETVSISFAFGGTWGSTFESNNFDVLLGDTLVASVIWNSDSAKYELVQDGVVIQTYEPNIKNAHWAEAEFEAVAPTDHAELTFAEHHSAGGDHTGTIIDNVQVERVFDTQIIGAEDDLLNGSKGDDIIFATAPEQADDAPSEGVQVFADEGDDAIYGGNGNDLLNGGDGNDFIFGGDGDDTINAGSGNNYVITGEGNDTILIDRSALSDGDDMIVVEDFHVGTDALELGDGMSVKDITSHTDNSIDYTEVIVGDDQGNDVIVKLLGVTQTELTDHQTTISDPNTADDLIQFMIDSGTE